VVDLVATLEKDVTKEEVNKAFKTAAETTLEGILLYSEEELVSCDFNENRYSSIVDAPNTSVIGGNMVKVLSWYDNETGYATRMVDLALYIAEGL
jgi:glyceraldehyde 3-phosphate dehydrogenase